MLDWFDTKQGTRSQANERQVISTFEFFNRYPNEHIQARRWAELPALTAKATSLKKSNYHQCNHKECRKQFTVRTGTIIERNLHKWLL